MQEYGACRLKISQVQMVELYFLLGLFIQVLWKTFGTLSFSKQKDPLDA